MSTVRDFIASVGRSDLERALGVRTSAITNALRRGKLPAGWYLAACDLAREKGLPEPDKKLFRFVRPEAAE